MDMNGEYRIAAPRERIWQGLNDPDVLGRCIPGCREVVKESDTTFTAKVLAKVGPVKANFAGSVQLKDIVPPVSYTLAGEGQGGAAGFAKGAASVSLDRDGDETVLRYTVHANVGGKLAQIGSRLIDSTAKRLADQFFANFAAVMAGEAPAGESETATAGEALVSANSPPVNAPNPEVEGAGTSTQPVWKRIFARS